MEGCWVAISRRARAGRRWARPASGVVVSGGGPAGAPSLEPPPGAGLAELLACGAPGEVRLFGIDELAEAESLPRALAELPASVLRVRVEDAVFDLTDPAGRAGWRLVLAGLVAHSQSRSSANDPTGARPARARASTSATPGATTVEAAPVDAAPVDAAPVDAAPVDAAPIDAAPIDAAPIAGVEEPEPAGRSAAPVGSATQIRCAGHRHASAPTESGCESSAIAATRQVGGGGPAGGSCGPQGGEQAAEHPGQVGEQDDVDRDPAGRNRRTAGRAASNEICADARGISPGDAGRLPGDRAPDGGPSAVAVPVSPGKCPGKGVRGGT